MITLCLITMFSAIRRSTIERNLKLHQVNFWNWRPMLVEAIYRLWNGYVSITIKEYQVGHGSILSTIPHSLLISLYLNKIFLNLIKLFLLNLSSNWWQSFLQEHAMLYRNSCITIWKMWILPSSIIIHQVSISILWEKSLHGLVKSYYLS